MRFEVFLHTYLLDSRIRPNSQLFSFGYITWSLDIKSDHVSRSYGKHMTFVWAFRQKYLFAIGILYSCWIIILVGFFPHRSEVLLISLKVKVRLRANQLTISKRSYLNLLCSFLLHWPRYTVEVTACNSKPLLKDF